MKHSQVMLGCILFCLFIPLPSISQNQNKLKLTVDLYGFKDGDKMYVSKFYYPMGENAWKRVDTVSYKDGKFYFEHHLDDGPRLFQINFSNRGSWLTVPFDNETVTIRSVSNIDIDLLSGEKAARPINEYVLIDGSKTADDFLYLDYGLYRPWYYSVGSINGRIKKFADSSFSKQNLHYILGLIDAKDLLNQRVKDILTAPLGFGPKRKLTPELWTECLDHMKYDSMWVDVYNSFDTETKESYNGKVMKEYLHLFMGQQAPDFTFTISEGKTMKLLEVTKANKLTILHFWSNGSIDRVKYHAQLSDFYKAYKSKGLEVVSVSFDANQEKWKRVIKSDNIPGHQICDFKEEESPIAQLYKMHPLSTVNILVDERGKMIGFDIAGPELAAYLYRILGEPDTKRIEENKNKTTKAF